jgi:ribonuclease HI
MSANRVFATAYIDGSGNSSRIQAAACVLRSNNEYFEKTKLLPPHTTNNVGEYNGALLAVRLAAEIGATDLEIFSDSKLIVHQLREEWTCRNRELQKLRDQVWEEASRFRSVSIQWIPREQNVEADGLCRRAIREALKP